MARRYRQISNYEKEILEMRAQGKSKRETCEIFGFEMKQLTNFITRYKRREEKI